jgi:outer membrane protein assembly factor BamB
MRTLNALVAVQINDEQPKELWRNTKKLADASSPLFYRDVLYLIKDGGLLSAIDSENGKILRQERVAGLDGRIFASPVAADGRLYLVSESGKVAVIRAGPAWELLTVNALNENCYASPALLDRTIVVRSEQSLWAFRE